MRRGLAGDVASVRWRGQHAVVIGMGAFAVEMIRTAVEHGAARVRVLCRRHGLVCPQMIDYMNYIRPIEADTYDHPVSGSGMMVGLWQRAYMLAGATPPECWEHGQFRPDGHTVSVSDLYFIAPFLGVLDTRQGVVQMVGTDGIWTNRGAYMASTVLIKALGFEIQEGNETMLGRSRITSSHFVAPGVFCVFEPHLNSGSQGSSTVEARTGGSGIPAFASYVHNVCQQGPRI